MSGAVVPTTDDELSLVMHIELVVLFASASILSLDM